MSSLRVALLSRHTSPLAQAGGGNAGGMNTYVLQTALALAALGVTVEMATEAGEAALAGWAQVADGVRLHRFVRSRFGSGGFTEQAIRLLPRCDAVHGHYWQSGPAGLAVAAAWDAPLVQSSHTLGRVKNGALIPGQPPESEDRLRVEDDLAARADLLIANTPREADELVRLYACDPARVRVVEPGVDTATFRPAGSNAAAESDRRLLRTELDLPEDALVLAFVGRLQRLKAPAVLLELAAPLRDRLLRDGSPAADRLALVICGAPAGDDRGELDRLRLLAPTLPPGVRVRFTPPRPAARLAALFRGADVVVVPSRSESFGLVALEAQACGTPVVAADVGGLPRAVGDGAAGVLVHSHDRQLWADAIHRLLVEPAELIRLRAVGPRHASGFTWDRTARSLLAAYDEAIAARRTVLT